MSAVRREAGPSFEVPHAHALCSSCSSIPNLLPPPLLLSSSSALLHTLAAKGSLGQIKARIRSEIFSALDQADEDPSSKPPLSNTNLLINELIREYMSFNQYRYSLGVFVPESNQPEVPPFDRNFISRELHVQENQHSVQMYEKPRAPIETICARCGQQSLTLSFTLSVFLSLHLSSPLLYSIIALLQQNKVGEVASAGVPIIDPLPSAAAAAAPLASSLASSSGSAQQPGRPQSQQGAYGYSQSSQQPQPPPQAQAQSASGYRLSGAPHSQPPPTSSFDDAPRPMHFVNRT